MHLLIGGGGAVYNIGVAVEKGKEVDKGQGVCLQSMAPQQWGKLHFPSDILGQWDLPHLSLVLLGDGMTDFWHRQQSVVVGDSKRECQVLITGANGQKAEHDHHLRQGSKEAIRLKKKIKKEKNANKQTQYKL